MKRDLQRLEDKNDALGYVLDRRRNKLPALGKPCVGSHKLTAREERELCVRLDSANTLRLVPEYEAREVADVLTSGKVGTTKRRPGGCV